MCFLSYQCNAKAGGRAMLTEDSGYATLYEFTETLSYFTGSHLCIHDVSGILHGSELYLPVENQIHSKAFCSLAKSTEKGYRLCLSCKMRANRKGIRTGELFQGHCPYGLYEIVKPVVIQGKTHCLIYLGNLLYQPEEARRRLSHTCMKTGVPENQLLPLLDKAEPILSPEPYIRLAYIVESYLRFLFPRNQNKKEISRNHWAVERLQTYIDTNFYQNFTLQDVAKLYFINEKYIGRLFREQMGCTFHDYLNRKRLEEAQKQLQETSKSVLEIASAAGYQNVSYFNRVFYAAYRMTPTQYRQRGILK